MKGLPSSSGARRGPHNRENRRCCTGQATGLPTPCPAGHHDSERMSDAVPLTRGAGCSDVGGLAPLRYVDDQGQPTQEYPLNPNGSPLGIAGLCSPDGRHLAMMPHPERCVLPWQWAWMPPDWRRTMEVSPGCACSRTPASGAWSTPRGSPDCGAQSPAGLVSQEQKAPMEFNTQLGQETQRYCCSSICAKEKLVFQLDLGS
ncbi:uncharacterized protein LOC119564644 [Chelonia mydas]|uniref:uncharacterized protein LOC119564644 n=1 Tax=Chelonia mydas TaxID=8469 RepID=UPI001CAA217A|nr:uncharacterized protein LOC119564644 [Chelonia mydas]